MPGSHLTNHDNFLCGCLTCLVRKEAASGLCIVTGMDGSLDRYHDSLHIVNHQAGQSKKDTGIINLCLHSDTEMSRTGVSCAKESLQIKLVDPIYDEERHVRIPVSSCL